MPADQPGEHQDRVEYRVEQLQGSGKVAWRPVRSCLNYFEGGQDAGGAAGVAAARSGDVAVPGAAEQGDGQVPESGHDLGSVAGADL